MEKKTVLVGGCRDHGLCPHEPADLHGERIRSTAVAGKEADRMLARIVEDHDCRVDPFVSQKGGYGSYDDACGHHKDKVRPLYPVPFDRV